MRFSSYTSGRGQRAMRILGVFVAFSLAVGLGTVLALQVHSKKSSGHHPSLTLYYSDGKTVLWHDANPAVEPTTQPSNAPYFVDLVRTELLQTFGDKYYQKGAWNVTTSLDGGLQASAEKLAASNLSAISASTNGKADEVATVLEDVTTGQIKALVGGADRSNSDHGQINYTTTKVSPGTSIMPFDYAALIDRTSDVGAGTALSDTLGPLQGWSCNNRSIPANGGNCLYNADFLFLGPMSLRYALATGRNVPAAQAGLRVGISQLTDFVGQMGATAGYHCYQATDLAPSSVSQCYGSAALGDGAYLTLRDATHAFATLANGGQKLPQTTLVSATLNGKSVRSWQQPPSTQVVRPDTAYIINGIMSDPTAGTLPGSCSDTNCTAGANDAKFQRYNGWQFAEDLGNSMLGTSAMSASWSAKYAVVAWAGNHSQTNRSFTPGTTTTQLLPLVRGLMQAAHTGKSPAGWQQPSDLQKLPASPFPAGSVTAGPTTDWYPSWYRQPAAAN